MLMLLVLLLFVATSSCVALRANKRFHSADRLPVQWSLTDEVNWSAPRPVALAFMPVLTVLLLGFATGLSLSVAPRPGQEHFALPVLVLMGAALLAGQQLHLWLAWRALNRGKEQRL
ncbi:hypothetical protein [Sphingomonas olei]|uniref:Uncharacterized protein n=1 Tax=Sphingomonas olei TaxID=1886787 RepID=A0ABY2QI41_9SPHN|nr:hypothetical protein [Sphingomonas olei]THG40473.1 hypothetical protein E5988_06480 [Sphingomonas olei]